MEASLIKHSLITIGKAVVILLALAFIFSKFGGCDADVEVPKTDNSKYFDKMKSDGLLIVDLMEKQYQDSLKTLASERSEDSIKVVADKYNGLYKGSAKKVRELIALGICDTVYIKVALNDCDSTIKSKNSLIAQKDSTNKSIKEEMSTVKEANTVLQSDVTAAKTVIKNQDNDYKALEKESNKSLKKQKRKTIGAIILASIIEGLTIFGLK